MSDTSWHSNVQYGTGGKASRRAEARVIFILIRKNAYWYERMSNGNMKAGTRMVALTFSKKQRFNRGFLAGLVAGILASGIMVLLNLVVGTILLPDVLGSAMVQAMPLSVFEYLHRIIGDDAKHYLFYIILVSQCLIFALSGGLWDLALGTKRFGSWHNEQGQLRWSAGFVLAFLLLLFTGCVFLPLTGAGFFGSKLVIGSFETIKDLAIIGAVFGFLYVLSQNWLILRYVQRYEKGESTTDSDVVREETLQKRRSLMRQGLTVLGLGALGILVWRFISGTDNVSPTPQAAFNNYRSKITPPPIPNYGEVAPVPGLSPEVTSNDLFYVVSKNLVADPKVDGNTWQLTIDGLVAQPYTLKYSELLAQPMQKQYETLECISNLVGGRYMSNALWEGVPLAHLLEKAGGVRKGATKVVLHAADDYSDSIHLAKALEPTTVVAVRMNGETLPQGHGYPARLLVPGIYGMKHVKWITHIEVVDTDYQGYWQHSGWSDLASVRITARIDTPLTGTTLSANQSHYVAGVAFAGTDGISRVDVSFDGGQNWQSATLKRPLSDLTWVLWEIPWKPGAGSYSIIARAIDEQGNVQSPVNAPPSPDGSSGYHNITVTIH
jgi:DMSO/TMAO reductase YedYZ molybdopterin-dependent catalytic subunit